MKLLLKLMLPGTYLAIVVAGVVLFLKVEPGVPPYATLAIQHAELIDVQVVAPRKGEAWLRLHMMEGDQEVLAAVRHYDLLQKIADVSTLRELSRGERLTLHTSGPNSFGSALPSVWEIDTNAGTVLSYAQASDVWRTHRTHGIIGGSLLGGSMVAFAGYLGWGAISTSRRKIFAPPHPQAQSNTTRKLLYRRAMHWYLSLVGTMLVMFLFSIAYPIDLAQPIPLDRFLALVLPGILVVGYFWLRWAQTCCVYCHQPLGAWNALGWGGARRGPPLNYTPRCPNCDVSIDGDAPSVREF